MTTPSVEDYLERIFELIEEKGYARVVDLAQRLKVQSPSVTRMIQKLDEQSYVEYERYRGVILTPQGEAIARAVKRRHTKLEEFLRILGLDEDTIQRDVEGLEHHLSGDTLARLKDLVRFFEDRPDWLQAFEQFNAPSGTNP